REQHREARGKCEEKVAGDGAGKREHQYRFAADPIGEAPQQRSENELHRRVGRQEQAELKLRRMKAFGIEREKRNDDTETHEIDEQDQENHLQGRRPHATECIVRSLPWTTQKGRKGPRKRTRAAGSARSGMLSPPALRNTPRSTRSAWRSARSA